ncbi:Rpn family recombination-promoting nuclease/putative transposase [Limosilactobacillus reuteri]
MCNNLSESYAKVLEKWERMTITSDPMFGMVMQNKEICLELINRALPQLKATEIVQLETQKDINVVASRRVRYDVYVQDEKGNIIVVEMQVTDHQNLPYRLRYYQEQIDHGLLLPDESYQSLRQHPTYVIIFCDFDYFGYGWARYMFEMSCTRNPQLKLGDQRTIVVFNALAKEFTNDEQPIKNFLALMRNRVDNESKFITKIQNEIVKVKEDPERRRGFMKFELDLMDARQEGKEEGIKESKQKLVQFLSSQNTDPAEIVAALVNVYQVPEKAAQEYVVEQTKVKK